MRSGTRVLVVDDDDSIREFVSDVLSDEGYEVVTAPHGRAALAEVDKLRPDMILLDMRMPTMNGLEFSHAYKRTPGPHAPIIVLTAARDVVDGATGMDAQAFLAKPFDLTELLELVNRHLDPR